jgi:hypothetical protein
MNDCILATDLFARLRFRFALAMIPNWIICRTHELVEQIRNAFVFRGNLFKIPAVGRNCEFPALGAAVFRKLRADRPSF